MLVLAAQLVIEKWLHAFFVVLCITDLPLHAHPLSCGHTHHLPTFLTRSPNGFHLTYFLEASPVKAQPKQPSHALTHTL